jgi:hypothetical protein
MLLPITEKKTQETLKIIGKKREKKKGKRKRSPSMISLYLTHWASLGFSF